MRIRLFDQLLLFPLRKGYYPFSVVSVTTQTCIIRHRQIDLLVFLLLTKKFHQTLYFASVAGRLMQGYCIQKINNKNDRIFLKMIAQNNAYRSMAANEKRSFVLKNLTSNRIRASRIATYEKSAKYCKVSFIYGVFKPYFDKKSCKQVSKIILVYVCVVFKAVLLSTYNGFISCVYFTKFKELPTLGN